MPSADKPVRTPSRGVEGRHDVGHSVGEGLGEPVNVSGGTETDLGLKSEGQQPAVLPIGGGLHPGHVADGARRDAEEVLGRVPITRPRRLVLAEYVRVDDERLGARLQDALDEAAPLAPFHEFDEPGLLKLAQVVPQALPRHLHLGCKLGRRCRGPQAPQQPTPKGRERTAQPLGLLQEVVRRHGSSVLLTGYFVKSAAELTVATEAAVLSVISPRRGKSQHVRPHT